MARLLGPRLRERITSHPLWTDVARPYWSGPGRRAGLMALGLMIALSFASTWGSTATAALGKDVYEALVDRKAGELEILLLYSVLLGLGMALATTAQVNLQSWVEIRWRRSASEHLIDRWLQHSNHFRLERDGRTDNPDARIEYDTGMFIALVLTLSMMVLSNVVSIVAFSALLWSKEVESRQEYPGLLVATAWAWAVFQQIIVHWAGRRLVPVTARQDAVQADFRFAMTQVRESSEQIAFFGGEGVERSRLGQLFDAVAANFRDMMAVRWRLNLTNLSLNGLSSLVPTLAMMPAMMSGRLGYGESIELGALSAQLALALVFIANSYDQWAMCAAAGRRLVTMLRSIDELPMADMQPDDSVDGHLRLHGLVLRRPDGTPLVGPLTLDVPAGGRCLISGPSGVGKSTLLRAIAGLWPHCDGHVELPAAGHRMFVPQANYLPTGTLKAALSYPDPDDTISDEDCQEVLRSVRLPALSARLHESARWSDELSAGEQQRVAFARVLLHRPQVLFLDESTSSLDEDTEALLYQTILDQLPNSVVVSVAHRSTLRRFHGQTLKLEPAGAVCSRVGEASGDERPAQAAEDPLPDALPLRTMKVLQ